MIGVYAVLLHGHTAAVLSPQGTIAEQEKNLIIFTAILGCTIVVPVLVLTFAIAWHYREANTKAVYKPDWSGNFLAEGIWWVIPTIVIGILAVVIVQSSHALDPYNSLASEVKPIRIQVVALEWRWLFMYPDQKVASIDYMEFPVNTPINLTITSDAPMNSFWIPQLSGQVYAMNGMSTQLHLAARTIGDYRGSSANISGVGFAGMNFTASAVSSRSFATWTNLLAHGSDILTKGGYDDLAKKTCDNTPYAYSLADVSLYNEVISKYMDPHTPVPSPQSTDATSVPTHCTSQTIPQKITKKFMGSN